MVVANDVLGILPSTFQWKISARIAMTVVVFNVLIRLMATILLIVEIQAPFSQLPILEVDGQVLCQSHAIAVFLARELGLSL